MNADGYRALTLICVHHRESAVSMNPNRINLDLRERAHAGSKRQK
jgi:hypothetical protein